MAGKGAVRGKPGPSGGNAEQLKKYWTEGEGAAKIRWGEPHDFDRCVSHLRKYVSDPEGLCNVLHRRALGVAPGQEDPGHSH
jgi:hypothetical protein